MWVMLSGIRKEEEKGQEPQDPAGTQLWCQEEKNKGAGGARTGFAHSRFREIRCGVHKENPTRVGWGGVSLWGRLSWGCVPRQVTAQCELQSYKQETCREAREVRAP